MKEFYEEVSVTKGMKQYLDQLRKIYPNSKSYEDVLWHVFFELGKIYNHHGEHLLKNKKLWGERRRHLLGIGSPVHVDWKDKIIDVDEKSKIEGEGY